MAKTRSVTVLGAGIGGVAAALALARRGVEVTVCEQAEAAGEVGAGLQIGPHGVRVLAALGLEDAALAVANRPEAVVLRDGLTGGRVARVPMGAAAVRRWGAPYLQMHRADLLEVLLEGARAAGVTFRFGLRAETVTEHGGLAFADGSTLQPELLVAADGVRSTVRQQVAGGYAPEFTGHVAWRGLVDAGRLPAPLLPNAAHVFMGTGRHLVTYPLRQGSVWNIVAVEEREEWAAEGWRQEADPDDVRRAFAGWCEPVTALTGALEETFLWGLFAHRPLAHWWTGNTVLVGDACHPMLPYLAQGATMALEDAWALAEEWARHDAPEAALAAYEARRKGRASRVQAASGANTRLFHMGPPMRGLAHWGLRGASLVPRLMMRRFDWLYGHDETAR